MYYFTGDEYLIVNNIKTLCIKNNIIYILFKSDLLKRVVGKRKCSFRRRKSQDNFI